MDSYVELSDVVKTFRSGSGSREKVKCAVNHVSLCLKKGESIGIIGTSGCGKTTILKMIMGLLKADSGEVTVKGTLGFVAQDPYASLDPSMTIFQIVAEPLIFSKKKRRYKDCVQEVERALAYVHLNKEIYEKRLPSQLSGGERQRVSIARALILEPDILILDEPTSMLDQEVKSSIIDLIAQIAESGKFGFLLVTHDIAMSVRICKKLLVMSDGKIVEEGKAQAILEQPQNEVTKALVAVSTDVSEYWKSTSV